MTDLTPDELRKALEIAGYKKLPIGERYLCAEEPERRQRYALARRVLANDEFHALAEEGALLLRTDLEKAERRVLELEAALEELVEAADSLVYPSTGMNATKGRGWFYQQNIRSAWKQAGHHMARQIRAALRSSTEEKKP